MLNASIDGLLFSSLSGYNMYNPSKYDSSMIHVLSNTEVTIKPVPKINSIDIEQMWRDLIYMPIDIKSITWPIDILELDNQTTGLVFRKRAFPKMEPLKNLLYNSDLLDWEKPSIKKLINNLLMVFNEIHSGGYLYRAFDMNHIYYNESSYEILIDFSIATSQNKVFSIKPNIPVESVSIEFLPPWLSFSNRTDTTMTDELYSVAAMLFRLMVGRMPYQGRLMDGHGDIMDRFRDVDPSEHIHMFEYYHDNPVFIFSPTNKTNSIGQVTSEEKFKNRWKKLPESIRKMFLHVFDEKHLTSENRDFYSVQEWINALSQEQII